jgi:alginate O-acetyltransferase complex protein AlgI
MFFNSLDFALFLPVVFLLYWFIFDKSIKAQNLLIVAASYFFYGCWDWRFLGLILFSTVVDFVMSRQMGREESPKRRLLLLWVSIAVNIGFLGVFKYYNFFVDSFVKSFTLLGLDIQPATLNIVLPVGISFYTFQTLSYSIDVYRKKIKATHDFVAFAAFVSFFPQLVAGPIERATDLLPQFFKKRKFVYDNAVDGMRQILWGLVKKVLVADNCARWANEIFDNYELYNGSTLILGAVLFAFQIYGDFSGYSDMAIGTSKLFGFKLQNNFLQPYFSRDIAEFWRRWHISLSRWFKDYLYIPLGGSRGSLANKIRNTFIIFLVSGFWHGANWTFVFWGALNALYFLPLLILGTNRDNVNSIADGRYLPSLKELSGILATFSLTTFAWIFFRAENITHAFNYIASIFSPSTFLLPDILPKKVLGIILMFVIVEWIGRNGAFAIERVRDVQLKWIRWSIYTALILSIFFLGEFSASVEFIYFQF